ncbi:MAG: Rieske (2Fe-2S) protein [Pyrinomonadaceae bacterium]
MVTHTRRRILLLFPALVLTTLTTTLAAAAARFLRPLAERDEDNSGDGWTTVAPLASLSGAEPLARTVSVEHRAGWSMTRREHVVYVLPQENNRVVLAVCPHEGCEVDWSADAREFLCPCHDSRFDSGGGRLSGPAVQDLTALPARVNAGILEVQYRPAPTEARRQQDSERG